MPYDPFHSHHRSGSISTALHEQLLLQVGFEICGSFDVMHGPSPLQRLITRSLQHGTLGAGIYHVNKRAMSSAPTCRVQRQQGVDLDCAMEVAEENLGWEKLEVRWAAVKVGPELHGLYHEEPDGKDAECVEVGRFILVLLRGLQGLHQEVS